MPRRKPSQITLGDIAAACGTSGSTVSRVLSGGVCAEWISPEVRERIIAAARSMGYRRRVVQRNRRALRHGVYALVVPDLADPDYAAFAAHCSAEMRSRGFVLNIADCGGKQTVETAVIHTLSDRGCDGVLLWPTEYRTRRSLDGLDIPPGVPVVLAGRLIHGVQDVVATDEVAVVDRLLARMVAMGAWPWRVITVAHDPIHIARLARISERFTVKAVHAGPDSPATGEAGFAEWWRVEAETAVWPGKSVGRALVVATSPRLLRGVPCEAILPPADDLAGIARCAVERVTRISLNRKVLPGPELVPPVDR